MQEFQNNNDNKKKISRNGLVLLIYSSGTNTKISTPLLPNIITKSDWYYVIQQIKPFKILFQTSNEINNSKMDQDKACERHLY